MTFFVLQAHKMIQANARVLGARAIRMIKPKSTDEDTQRRELILNTILFISIGLLIILEATTIYDYTTMSPVSYDGLLPLQFAPILLFFIGLYGLSRKGYIRTASYILIGMYVLGTMYAGITWGASLPATLLSTTIVIVTSSILIGPIFGLGATVVMVTALLFMGLHEKHFLHIPFWRYEQISITDIISYSGIFLFIGFITWLSNREIKKSLNRARTSELLLHTERNMLEERVAQRSGEIISLEKERTERLENAAVFGTISQGLIHDLINSITSLSLHFDKIPEEELCTEESRKSIHKIVGISKRMNESMASIKHYIARQQRVCVSEFANITKEAEIVRDICAYRARHARISMAVDVPSSLICQIDQIQAHQIILNLVTNALEAHESSITETGRIIRIQATSDKSTASISVWNNGPIIPAKILSMIKSGNAVTTKQTGSGSGIQTIRRVLNTIAQSTFSVTSTNESGTEFIITLPIYKHPQSEP